MTNEALKWCELNKATLIETKQNGFYYQNIYGKIVYMPFSDMK